MLTPFIARRIGGMLYDAHSHSILSSWQWPQMLPLAFVKMTAFKDWQTFNMPETLKSDTWYL
jgi:hypothetical protein